MEASSQLHAQTRHAWYYVEAMAPHTGCVPLIDPCILHLVKGALMAHQHPPRFLKIVDDAKTRVRETNVDAVKIRIDRGDKFVLVDVREESEFAKDHLPGAIHLGKGIIERDIEARVPELNTEMILYCGGGFRSALAADNLQKMGYTNVISMDGGIRDWREKGYPLQAGPRK
jgi:rhodanese-related sulfurtransferase